MSIKLDGKYGKATNKMIYNFERKYKSKLPDDYKNFLFVSDGGYVKNPIYINFPVDDLVYRLSKGEKIFFQSFMGLGTRPLKSEMIEFARDAMEEYYPTRFFPISDTGTGDHFCICLRNDEDYGKIYFVLHDAYHEEDDVHWDEFDIDKTGCNDMNGVYYVAPTFTDFLDMIHEDGFVE